MQYRFITILHNMKLASIKNKGMRIFPGARISNGSQIQSETLYTESSLQTIGALSINEFEDSVYIYIDGKFDGGNEEYLDRKAGRHTFFLLRQVQNFIHNLWEIKDNNVYVRDGFLIAYSTQFENGSATYKASLSEIFSFASGEQRESLFSDKEIQQAAYNFQPHTIEDYDEDSFGGKIPSSDHFFKTHGTNRMVRAFYFTIGARRSAILPMKIVHYCNALECLFTIGTSEVSHKIAERVAIILGTSQASKKNIFSLIKKAYGFRSKLVHGQYLKVTEESLVYISEGLDNILRELMSEIMRFSPKMIKRWRISS
ncbi:hypothetical protein BN988_02873 [Oceanobacillus picturae]|uniref:Uncharacterized protein n=1 Tax=Oceanobacillus picturae TaxID=171693 RepID=W9AF15_9BACI|nr:HEPN domain-containing protein [Oceanobacillus picturae]CDO04319.1 hypothetical protein BN988_02873 [Oceanobacillus picturae]